MGTIAAGSGNRAWKFRIREAWSNLFIINWIGRVFESHADVISGIKRNRKTQESQVESAVPSCCKETVSELRAMVNSGGATM